MERLNISKKCGIFSAPGARDLLLTADQNVVKQEDVPQLSIFFWLRDDNSILDQVSRILDLNNIDRSKSRALFDKCHLWLMSSVKRCSWCRYYKFTNARQNSRRQRLTLLFLEPEEQTSRKFLAMFKDFTTKSKSLWLVGVQFFKSYKTVNSSHRLNFRRNRF